MIAPRAWPVRRLRSGFAYVCVASSALLGTARAALSQPIARDSWLTPGVRAAARNVPQLDSAVFDGSTADVNGSAPATSNAFARGTRLTMPAPATQPTQRSMPGGISPWVAPLASAILPGAGQGLLLQQRGVVYAAAEGYLVLQAIRSNRDATRERDAYREIARSVARAAFGGQAPDGDWPYYERMQFTLESGQFNLTPGNGFTPESDPETFNGSIWQLARNTFWRNPEAAPPTTSPEYQRAIEFYQRRAASDEFRWSWRDAQLEQDVYRQTIVRANEASRRTKQVIGLLLANHALSLVDSYMSVRLRVFGTAGTAGDQRLGVTGSVVWP